VIGATARTKLLIGGGCVLTAVVVIGIAVRRVSQSPAAASEALASAAPAFAFPNSPVSPTPASSPAAPPNTGLCGCADIPAIQERIREAQAVIPLYQAEMNRLQASTAVPPYSSQQYTGFQSTLVPVLDALADQNGISTLANGDTSMFCNVTPNPQATVCMQSSTIKHEDVQRALCKQHGWSLSGGTWKQQIGLVAVYQDEINAYQAELDYLQPLLAALKPSCSAGWKGEITSSFTISTSQSDSMPPMKTGVQVTSSTTIYNRNKVDKWSFNGVPGQIPRITLGKWSATLSSDHSLVQDSAFQLGARCAGKILQGHSEVKNILTGSGTGRAALIITITGAVAHISVVPNESDPPGKTTSSRIQEGWAEIVQNDCGHRVSSGSPTPIRGADEPLPQTGVDFDAAVDPQHPVALKGHLSKSVADGGTTTLDWNLTLPGNSH
jgi:hypothetical protein